MVIDSAAMGSLRCGSSGREWTRAEIHSASRTLAADWRSLGVGPGRVVALGYGNEASFFLQLFALWSLGACVLPLPPRLKPSERARLLRHSGAAFVVDASGVSEGLAPGPVAEESALLLYTSGTTAEPKGVLLSRRAIKAKLACLREAIPAGWLERSLCFLPLSFGHGLIGNSLSCLSAGGTLFLEPAFSEALLLRLGEYLENKNISFFSSVPSVWSGPLSIAEAPAASRLRGAFCASAPLPAALRERARRWLGAAPLCDVYGITEAASWVGIVGGASFGARLSLDPGSSELLLEAPYLMSGYHRDPAATAAVLRGGVLRTGDLGRAGPGGAVEWAGRIKEQINRGGIKVSPLEVEARLREIPGVGDACVFSVPDPVQGESVAAALTGTAGAALDADFARGFCRETLSEEKVPELIFIIDRIPLNERGKPDRAALRALARKNNPE